MGIADLGKGETPDDSGSDKPSVSYTYTYEAGRNEIEDWTEEQQETMARAYQAVSDGGIVRTTFKRSPQYVNLHDAIAHFYAAMAEALEEQNFVPVLDFILSDDSEVTADILQQYLEENPDVAEELLGRVEA